MTQRRQEKMGEKMTKGSSALSSFSPSSSSSSPSSLGLLLHHFVLEAKVKWVKVGKRTMEGWEMTVLRMPRCQQETTPSSKPGRNIVAKIIAGRNGEASASPFPRRERRQEAKMSRNLEEKEGQRY